MTTGLTLPEHLPLTFFCEPGKVGRKHAFVLRGSGHPVRVFDSLGEMGAFERDFNAVAPAVQDWLLEQVVIARAMRGLS